MAFFDWIAKLGASVADIFSKSGETISAVDATADKLVFWDESEGKLTYAVIGTNLSMTGTTLNATGGSGDVATDAIWDAKGDLAVGTGANTAARLAVSDNGRYLKTDSTKSTGLDYGSPFLTPGGRLTLESGVPVSTTDQTAKTNLYYTPYVHDGIRLYTGSTIREYTFSEITLASPSLTDAKNYDVFLYDNSGTLTLELSAAWTNNTTRADALAWQSGLGYVKSGAATRLWLGTIRASATDNMAISFAADGNAPLMYVWNAYNRVLARVSAHDQTDSWTYTTAAWRQKNNSSVNQINIVCGSSQGITASLEQTAYNASDVGRYASIGLDSTTAIGAGVTSLGVAGAGLNRALKATLSVNVSAGFHYVAALEYSEAAGTTTWYGDGGAPTKVRTGLTALWEY